MRMISEKQKDCKMSDRDWETYYMYTSVLNGLNSVNGKFSHKGSKLYNPFIADLLERTQSCILYLMDETGRSKDFEKCMDKIIRSE